MLKALIKAFRVRLTFFNLFKIFSKRHKKITTCIDEYSSRNKAIEKIRDSNKNNTYNKKIGVLITTYNNENSIYDTINSVIKQTRIPDLICVADDCSNDNTLKIIKKLAANYSNIRLIERPGNVGIAANRDLAIRKMEVDFITTLDGDDLFFPEKIEMEMDALNGSKNRVVFSDYLVVGKTQDKVQSTMPYSNEDKNSILAMVTSRSKSVPRDMMFSKELFIKAEGFDVFMNIYEDWAFKMRLAVSSSDNGWIHSGGIGTIYDRRDPGLSGVDEIEHAFWQLLALARNVDILKKYPEAIRGGFLTVSRHLKGNMLLDIEKIENKSLSRSGIDIICDRLSSFWKNSSYGQDYNRRIRQFIDSVLCKNYNC